MTMSNAEKEALGEVAKDLRISSSWLSGQRGRALAGNAAKLEAILAGDAEKVKGVRGVEVLNGLTAEPAEE
jgi:hypothetical protein